MKNQSQVSKVCTAGHGFRCVPSRVLCECGKPLVLKDSEQGRIILAARVSGKKKLCAAGYRGRDKVGKTQRYRTYGDHEAAAPRPQ
jgi:hypothetical protein